MRVLISAYACEPHRGSEPEVGLQTVLAAASQHEVWVITRRNNLPSLETLLAGNPLRQNIHLTGLDVEGPANRLKKKAGLLTLHWYHDVWQRRLASVAKALDDEINFDVAHHVTFASYWTRVGVTDLGKPLVWGPVGGGARPPKSLIAAMGLSGGVADMARVGVRPLLATVLGARKLARKANVVIAQNSETAAALDAENRAVILPNALVAGQSVPDREAHRERTANVVCAGRLIPLKGVSLAIEALAQVSEREIHLDIFGDGPALPRLKENALGLQLGGRVRFHGEVKRSRLLDEIGSAGVLVHPALHEEGGFVVAEALAQGTPVVCLNRGGPPILTRYWPDTPSRVIEPTNVTSVVRDIARAIDELMGQTGNPSPPTLSFKEEILKAYDLAVA